MAAERIMTPGNLGTAAIRGDEPSGRVRSTAARLRMAALVFSADRRELWNASRERFWRAAIFACGLFCVLFLTMLVLWLTVTFTTFGVLAPRNQTVVVVLFVCALSVAGAIFLVLEMDSPFGRIGVAFRFQRFAGQRFVQIAVDASLSVRAAHDEVADLMREVLALRALQAVDERDRLRADAHAQRALRIARALRRDAAAAGARIDALAGARQRRRLEVAARARARVEPALRVERREGAGIGRGAVGLAHDVAVVREAVARERGEDVALGAGDRAFLPGNRGSACRGGG